MSAAHHLGRDKALGLNGRNARLDILAHLNLLSVFDSNLPAGNYIKT